MIKHLNVRDSLGMEEGKLPPHYPHPFLIAQIKNKDSCSVGSDFSLNLSVSCSITLSL